MLWFNSQPKQDVCLLTETNSVKDDRLIAGTLHAESPDTAEAWGLDSNQMCKDKKTGRYIQLISSPSCDPVRIYRGKDVRKTDTSIISSQTEDQEMTFISEGKNKTMQLLLVGIIVGLLTLTTSVVVLVVVL